MAATTKITHKLSINSIYMQKFARAFIFTWVIIEINHKNQFFLSICCLSGWGLNLLFKCCVYNTSFARRCTMHKWEREKIPRVFIAILITPNQNKIDATRHEKRKQNGVGIEQMTRTFTYRKCHNMNILEWKRKSLIAIKRNIVQSFG